MLIVDETEIGGDAAEHLKRLKESGGSVGEFTESGFRRADVIVDAIFGTGFRGAAEAAAAKAIDVMNDVPSPVIAADIPSGVAGATGKVEGPAVRAAMTIAMAAEKYGTATGDGAVHAGNVVVADIGILVSDAGAHVPDDSDVNEVLPKRRPDAHKRSGGAVAVLAGSADMTGAAVLAAQGAARAGAGYVTVGSVSRVTEVVQASLPEVLAQYLGDQQALAPTMLSDFEEVVSKAGALALGPGIGQGDGQRDLVERVLDEVEIPVVLDADGLNVLGKHTESLKKRANPTVITPHPAELARLLEVSVEEVQADRIEAARKAASDFGCVVVLKGFRSVIAGAGGEAVVNPTGGPELATAGTGDVLSGVVASFLAAGVDPFDAAWAASYIHGVAGEVAADSYGASGAVAGDIAEALPEAMLMVSSTGV